jgi:NAD(P)-dependent dehydrogenase (short-subunit alcohol dehydrogenase family)
MSLYSLLSPRGPTGFGYGSTAEKVTAGLSLSDKTILITGCNSGLGFEAMRVLALRGAHIIGAARTVEKAKAACALVAGETSGVACELSDPTSVRDCIRSVSGELKDGLDAIICNAGIMALPKLAQAYGYELQFFTNHIGHFILVNGLLSSLTEKGRVVVLSSSAHRMAPPGGIQFDNLSGEKGYKPWTAYGQSKFANLLFAKELARRLLGSGRTANAVHPGVIHTNLGRNIGAPAAQAIFYGVADALALKTIGQGAATACYVAVHPAAAKISGEYFADCNIQKPRADANDAGLAQRLWEVSESVVADVATGLA